ncbi:hypothetical protein [Methylomonas sp. AM2-LC]|uniref:hypothetical protein n=1 Tax=Methylomonas sp. AM2-LC TaxID=3153301 RepID=UPI0032642565
MSIIAIRAVIGLAMTLLAPVSESHQVVYNKYCYPDETTAFIAFDAQGYFQFGEDLIDPVTLLSFSLYSGAGITPTINYVYTAQVNTPTNGFTYPYNLYLPTCDNIATGSLNPGDYLNLQTVLDAYFVPDETLITEIIGGCILVFILGFSTRYIVSAMTIR